MASLPSAPWPTVDPQYLIEQNVTYVIQVNGKVRARYELPKEISQENILSIAKKDQTISKYLHGTIKKVIFVPGKLLNIVIE